MISPFQTIAPQTAGVLGRCRSTALLATLKPMAAGTNMISSKKIPAAVSLPGALNIVAKAPTRSRTRVMVLATANK